jgi:hypothetical protein
MKGINLLTKVGIKTRPSKVGVSAVCEGAQLDGTVHFEVLELLGQLELEKVRLCQQDRTRVAQAVAPVHQISGA